MCLASSSRIARNYHSRTFCSTKLYLSFYISRYTESPTKPDRVLKIYINILHSGFSKYISVFFLRWTSLTRWGKPFVVMKVFTHSWSSQLGFLQGLLILPQAHSFFFSVTNKLVYGCKIKNQFLMHQDQRNLTKKLLWEVANPFQGRLHGNQSCAWTQRDQKGDWHNGQVDLWEVENHL